MKNAKTIIISDDKKDLFRIHFFDDCIKFDSKFSQAITDDNDICRQVIEINRGWAEKDLEVVDVLEKLAFLIEKNSDKFEGHYLQDYELNKNGKYVELVPIDSLMIDMDKKANDFYKYLKKEDVLIEIDKKQFEKNIKNGKYEEMYIDLYSEIYKKKSIKFYQYKLNDNFDRKTCNIIGTSKEVLFGYTF